MASHQAWCSTKGGLVEGCVVTVYAGELKDLGLGQLLLDVTSMRSLRSEI